MRTPVSVGVSDYDTVLVVDFGADTGDVLVRGPTLIAFEPRVTQAQVDSSEELATVIGDFEHYLQEASDSLHTLGVALVQRPTGPIRLVESGARDSVVRRFVPDADSANVGYVLVAPGRPERAYYGVDTDAGIVATVRAFLGGR